MLAIADKQPSGPTYHSNYDAEKNNLSEKVVKAQKILKVTQKVLDMAQRVESQSSRFKRTMGEVQDFYLGSVSHPISLLIRYTKSSG